MLCCTMRPNLNCLHQAKNGFLQSFLQFLDRNFIRLSTAEILQIQIVGLIIINVLLIDILKFLKTNSLGNKKSLIKE